MLNAIPGENFFRFLNSNIASLIPPVSETTFVSSPSLSGRLDIKIVKLEKVEIGIWNLEIGVVST